MNANPGNEKSEKGAQPDMGRPAAQDEGRAEETVLEFAPEAAPPPTGGSSAASSDQPAVWYTARRDGQRAGPYSLPALKQLLAAGTLSPGVLVWKVGMANWVPAGEVPDLVTKAGDVGSAPRLPGGTPSPTPGRSTASGGGPSAPQRPSSVFEHSDELLRSFNNILSNAAFYRILGLACLGLGLLTLVLSMLLSFWQLTWFTGAVLFFAIGLGGQFAGQVLDLLHRIESQLKERANATATKSEESGESHLR